MATPSSSRRPRGNKKQDQDQDSPQIQSNLSGLKHQLHGTSYQVKLGIVVSLANAKKVLDPTDKFSFTVTAEDPTAGKFDDIVYAFQHGDKTGTLKIQAKHKLTQIPTKNAAQDGATTAAIHAKNKEESSIPKIMLNDCIVDSKNDFCIQQYLKSFRDQPQTTNQNVLEGLIICTNADIDDDAKVIWNEIDTAALGDSTTSLDSYIASIFNQIGGKCYQLKTHYKRAALVRMLINAFKSKEEMVTWQRPLFKEYRAAILTIIDKDSISGNVPSLKLTDDFLDPTYSNPKPGYEAFRKEFKEQFQREFGLNEIAWERFKRNIQIPVAENFLLDEKNQYLSSDSFPDENVEESLKFFCDRFRLVCGTYNEQGLDEAIVHIWRNFYFGAEHLGIDPHKERVEENMVTEKLFKTFFNWLMDPFAEPLRSDDIKKDLENIENRLAYIKLKVASDKLCEKIVESSFRLRPLVLAMFYECIKSNSFQEFEAYDVRFGVTILSDMMSQQKKKSMFIEDHEFVNFYKKNKSPSLSQYASCLIIICNTMGTVPVNMLKMAEMQIFLIKKSSSSQSRKQTALDDFRRFRICDLTEESWNQFLGETIPLCTTTIFPSKIFQNNFRDLPIMDVIKLLDQGKKMEENNNISKNFRGIESTYVHRPWIEEKIQLERSTQRDQVDNIYWTENSPILKYLKDPKWPEISLKEITKRLKERLNLNIFFGEENNLEEEHKPIIGDESKKVLILLGEAGLGKSTNLTWLAWHLRKQNPSSLLVRCNLSDHCTDFKPFIRDRNNGTEKVIDETEAIRMLYKFVHSSIQLEQNIPDTCSKCLVFLNGSAILNEDLMKHHGLSLTNSIQLLIFKEKFNAGELVLLLDGFDEIAPDYKEVVLKFLSHFEQFKGVRNLYLTSRPYDFKKEFERSLKGRSFFQLKPLSMQEKASMLYKIMKVKWNKGNIDDEEVSDSYKLICYMVLCSLGDMSDVPLNLMMLVDILGEHVNHNENINLYISSKTSNQMLFETILDLSKPSLIVEQFVKVKIRHLLYDKNGTDEKVAYKPQEMERFKRAVEEAKLLHGLVALWIIFNYHERNIILSACDILQAETYMEEIHKGSEKTGIIHGIKYGVPIFIHRSFVEYLAAWWIVKQRIEGNQQDRKNISCPESFWDDERKELLDNIDTILTKRHPLHKTIIKSDWSTVESLLSTNPELLYERDDGDRTPLHLIVLYYDYVFQSWPQFLPDFIDSEVINCKEKLFGWTALDYAFHRIKANEFKSSILPNRYSEGYFKLIFYLLRHGASLNVETLFEQVVSAGKDKIHNAAIYNRYVMGYLSRAAIMYESHDACKRMKQFCDKVVCSLINEKSLNFDRIIDKSEHTARPSLYMLKKKIDKSEEKTIIQDVIEKDSVWLLESIIQQTRDKVHCFESIRYKYFDLALQSNSIFMLKYFRINDPFILDDNRFWECIVYSIIKNYKIEFKYFFDLYCSRLNIEDFRPCSIQRDEACYFIGYTASNVKLSVCDVITKTHWKRLDISINIMIEENLLSLLLICVATARPSMLSYLIESCKLHVCAGLVYFLAMVTNHLYAEQGICQPIDPSKAYECLLDLASNINDMEANKMLRLAIKSNLFDFSKCLIERYNIDFQADDEGNGSNVFHLCVSNKRSFWIKEIPSSLNRNDYDNDYRFQLFRSMLVKKREMNCFVTFDRKGPSVFHLAMENGLNDIVHLILAQKLGISDFYEISNLSVDAIRKITFCYRAVHEVSKSIVVKGFSYEVLCMLAKQIAKISLTNREEVQEANNARLLLQEDAKELYTIAMKCRSLFLMYYLHREFPSAIPPMIYGADWLACTAKSLLSPNFLDVTKWLLSSSEVEDHANMYEGVEKCDEVKYDMTQVNLDKLVKRVDAELSTNRSMDEVGKLKLLTLAICLKDQSMIKQLCENLNVNIDWKDLIVIMEIVHFHLIEYYVSDLHKRYYNNYHYFDPLYKYLFKRTSYFGEIDAEGRYVLHLVVQYGLGCMAMFLIKNNLVDVTTINEQNGWNICHYYASRKTSWECCSTGHNYLLIFIINRVLVFEWLVDNRGEKIKELCFNNTEGRKSVIHVAVETGNIDTAEAIICYRLGIFHIDYHIIMYSYECSRFRECYDELSQIAAQLPFDPKCDFLLHKLAKLIHKFSLKTIQPITPVTITDQASVEDNILEDACRAAIKNRSVSRLEHLIAANKDQIHQALSTSTSDELVACTMECIRSNRTGIFKVLIGFYCNSQGILPSVEVDFFLEENDKSNESTIDEYIIQWPIIDEFAKDVLMNRNYLLQLVLTVAYGRLPMTRFLVETLQLEVNKSLILLVMKALKALPYCNCMAATPVYEYLASRCVGKPNLLHLSAQAGICTMLEYLLKEKKIDPNDVDSENGWNPGHYCVSQSSDTSSENILKVFNLLLQKGSVDCFNVYDRKGRSVLHLGLENDHTAIVKYIIDHRIGIRADQNLCNELRQILELLPENISQQKKHVIQEIIEKLTDQQIALAQYKQLFKNPFYRFRYRQGFFRGFRASI